MKNKKRKSHQYQNLQIGSPIGHLIRIGRIKSYVTYDDILRVLPRPEEHLQYLELIFGTLMAANIPLIDEER